MVFSNLSLAGRIAVIGGCLEYTGAPYFAAITGLKLVRLLSQNSTTSRCICCPEHPFSLSLSLLFLHHAGSLLRILSSLLSLSLALCPQQVPQCSQSLSLSADLFSLMRTGHSLTLSLSRSLTLASLTLNISHSLFSDSQYLSLFSFSLTLNISLSSLSH